MDLVTQIAKELNLKESQVKSAVELMDDGNTIPFIARYRKEVTGNLSDVALRDIEERLQYLRHLAERKEEVIRLIEEQEKMTDELREEILKAEVLQRVEDLYKPFKQKKSTRASKAKEKGLEPLAEIIWKQEVESGNPEDFAVPFLNEEKGVADVDQALSGAMDILAERIADDPALNELIREKTFGMGIMKTEAVDPEESTVYDMYYEYQEGLSKMANHRVLAINRGEKEKKLKVKVQVDVETLHQMIRNQVVENEKSIFFPLLESTIQDGYKRLMAPSIEREIRNALTERAEKEAVKIFAKNTEKLLMQPPVKDIRVIALDPGFRTGCKVTALDETGKLLAYTTIYPVPPKADVEKSKATLLKLIDQYQINAIAIGNGTASRETEQFVANMIQDSGKKVHYAIVSEAGASVYSASKLAQEEYPDLDVTTRGALSIGRRLQDPLAELVKIDPKSIGVGQYQHDVNQSLLENALENVVEDCVNRVGVDLNTASSALLSYIAGINSSIAKNIVKYREENGKFHSRTELKKVSKLGPKAFEQCAGFMRIADGKEALDSTAVHPESYQAAKKLLTILGIREEEIVKGGAATIKERIIEQYPSERAKKQELTGKTMKGLSSLKAVAAESQKDKKKEESNKLRESMKKMAESLEVGEMTLSDIVEEIARPARDPRDDVPAVIFREDVLSLEDLRAGMQLSGVVRNVVDFGAFVDIGVKNDGLVHISEMSDKYIKHPMDVVSVGDTVTVRILDIDMGKQKVSLSMKGCS